MLFTTAGGLPSALAQTNEPSSAQDALKIRRGLRLADFRVHDPFIVAHQPTKTYYLYTASGPRQGLGRSGVVTYKSKDLREWEGPFVVFTVPAMSTRPTTRFAVAAVTAVGSEAPEFTAYPASTR